MFTINAGSALDLINASSSIGGLAGPGTVVNTGSTALRTLTLIGAGGTFTGGINPASNPQNTALAIALNSGSTETLSGATAHTYTGATTIASGTLALNESTVAGTSNLINAASALVMGGGTLTLSGGSQTFASLATTAATNSFIIPAASTNLTFTSGTQNFGANSYLNFNTAAGGNNGASVGTSVITLNTGTPGAVLDSYFATVTDAGGVGFATTNASNQIIRLATVLLPASGAVSTTDYSIDNHTGTDAGSNALTLTASEAASSISVSTTANVGTLALGTNVLANSNWLLNGTMAYNITGTAPGGLMAASPGGVITFNNLSSGALTISAPILDNSASGLTLAGTGTTILTGTGSTYSGATTITGATLQLGNVSTAGSVNNSAIAIGAGGTLNIKEPTGTSIASNIVNNGALTITIPAAGNLTLSGNISGAAAFPAVATNTTLNLAGTNSYTAATSVTGNLVITPTGSLGATAVTVNNGGVLTVQSLAGLGAAVPSLVGGSTLKLQSNSSGTFSVGTAPSTGYQVGAGGTQNYNFAVDDLDGTTTGQTLTFTSTQLGGAGTGTANINVTGGHGYTLNFGAVNEYNNTAINSNTAGVTVQFASLNIDFNNPYTLAVGGAGNVNFAGPITQNNATRTLNTTFTNTGTVTLGGSNAFANSTGAATLAFNGAGTVNINNAGALGTGTTTGTITIGAAVKFDNTSGAPVVESGAPATGYVINSNFSFLGTNPLSFGVAATPIALGGAIRTITTNGTAPLTLAGIISGTAGTGGITKAGPGTLILTGVNTYTGTTAVNAGTLTVSGAGVLASTDPLTIGAAGTFNYLPTLSALSKRSCYAWLDHRTDPRP